jgi:GTP-binding protein EngB required for normal cell division
MLVPEAKMPDTNIAVGDHRDLLDIIDSLRSQGVSHYVDLPEIIVCGDQSAGKSSVLEAISRMPFPTKDGLCTRFATELVLRRGPDANAKVSIIPSESRFGEDREILKSWQPQADIGPGGLGLVTEEAELVMADPTAASTADTAGRSTSTGREFFDDILRVELTGPEQPHLTMVDLPGLFRRGNKEQSDADVHIVRDMVERYMARPRSIILTVVSAKYEYVLQDVTSMARLADPEGLRTMGLITKPDTLDVGSDSESYFVRLAQNKEEELRLGWHVLKNRNFDELKRNVSSATRDKIESEFFSKGLWASIDASHCGVAALRTRLSALLRDQILDQLESLVQDVKVGIDDCDARLKRLGPERKTRQQQLSYLLRVSEEYTSLATQAVEGTYTAYQFFGKRKEIDKFRRRLRAVVQYRLREFADEMRLNGQSQFIFDSEDEDNDDRKVRDSPRISRSDYVKDVASRLKYSKGRELPGLFNPLVVHDLFNEQFEPWKRITRLLVEDILEAAHQTTQEIVEYITASDVSEGVLKSVRQGIEDLKVDLDAQVDELLESVEERTITYNPQLTENVQQIQQDRRRRKAQQLIRKTFGLHIFDDADKQIMVNPIQLLNLTGKGVELDMDQFGSALAVDYMEAYYQVALRRFIDDVSVLAIENRLIDKIPTLYRSSGFPDMSDEDLSHLAGETPESSQERKRLEAKQAILRTGLQSLKSLQKRGNVVRPTKQDRQGLPEDSAGTSARTPSRSGWSSVDS